ncbi:hypothetical protein B4Q13_18945 [Lacticaseibacillus rhamnosus]
MIDPTIRENPFPYYDKLYAQGRLVRTGLALISSLVRTRRHGSDALRPYDEGDRRRADRLRTRLERKRRLASGRLFHLADSVAQSRRKADAQAYALTV